MIIACQSLGAGHFADVHVLKVSNALLDGRRRWQKLSKLSCPATAIKVRNSGYYNGG